MTPTPTRGARVKVRSIEPSHTVLAATLIALGIQGLVIRNFTPIWSGVPKTMPAREAVAYICAFISLGSGVGLLWRRTARTAALALLAYLILWMALVRLPAVVRAPVATGPWWAAGQTAVLIAAALVLYASFTDDATTHRRVAVDDRRVRLASVLYGLGLIPFGIAHFTYLARTVSMVPAWLPWHFALACLTGSAFIVAGLATAVGVWPKLATTLSAWQMGLFTLLVWGPVMVSRPTPADWQEAVVSWVLTIAAWVVAAAYRGVPWFAFRPGLELEPNTMPGAMEASVT